MARSTVRFWFSIIVIPTFLVVAVLGYFAWRQSVPGIRAVLEPVPRWIGVKTPLAVDLHAVRGGVRSVEIRLKQGPARVVLTKQAFTGPESSAQRVELVINGGTLGLREGGAVLEVRARDGFWRPVAVEVKGRRFRSDVIDVKDDFLERKLPELLPERGGAIPRDQLLEAFLTVNRDRRKQAEETKRTLAAKTQPRPLWDGVFLQPRNTKVFSNFAETRTYRYHGREVDTQVHFGYDLAAVRHGPVPAANAGVVVFAGPLSIYGNTVIVDHGLGLQTLYAHLSTIGVKEGDQVRQEQELRRSGDSGLALGDHPHLQVLIGGISVTPVEWWDARWIRDHIGRPLRQASLLLIESIMPELAKEQAPPPPRRRRAAVPPREPPQKVESP